MNNLTSLVDSRCAELVNEGGRACTDVMGQITERFQALTSEVTVEVRRQCDTTKQVTSVLSLVRLEGEEAVNILPTLNKILNKPPVGSLSLQ